MLGKGHGGLYKMPQQRKKEESERLRGERDQIKSIDLGFERWQVVRFRKARGGQTFHKLHVLGMDDYLWDRVSERLRGERRLHWARQRYPSPLSDHAKYAEIRLDIQIAN